MKNILWIIGGVAIGYYIATKTNILNDPREAIPTNQPLLPSGSSAIPANQRSGSLPTNQPVSYRSGSSMAINDYPRAYQQWPRYVNRDSKVEAQMVI